jgi:hypothetical protein
MERPYLGHGAGLRVPHYAQALDGLLDVAWVECITENFFGEGGRPRAVLKKLRTQMPIVFHGVSMGLGSPSVPSDLYLERVMRLAHEFEPAWVSDHLCWTSFGRHYSHDLLPLPFTEEALVQVVQNVQHAQEKLRRPLVVENISSYATFTASTMTEWEFLSELCARTDCALLLDLNNVLVSSFNHGFDAMEFLRGIPPERVWQLHLANHTDCGHYKLDSHRGAVPDAVWQLYDYTLRHWGRVSSLVEWDDDVPDFAVLSAQAREAALRADRAFETAETDRTTLESERG